MQVQQLGKRWNLYDLAGAYRVEGGVPSISLVTVFFCNSIFWEIALKYSYMFSSIKANANEFILRAVIKALLHKYTSEFHSFSIALNYQNHLMKTSSAGCRTVDGFGATLQKMWIQLNHLWGTQSH